MDIGEKQPSVNVALVTIASIPINMSRVIDIQTISSDGCVRGNGPAPIYFREGETSIRSQQAHERLLKYGYTLVFIGIMSGHRVITSVYVKYKIE